MVPPLGSHSVHHHGAHRHRGSVAAGGGGSGRAPPAVPLAGLNVIIPMGGQQTAWDGYRFPKPLVNIVGRPMLFWLLDSLSLEPQRDTVFLAVPRRIESEHAVERRLRAEYPSLDLRLVSLDFDTRGAAETLFVVLQHMTGPELSRRTISLDCDTIYFVDVLEQFRRLPPGSCSTWYFEDKGDRAIYSYVTLEDPPEEDDERSGISSLSLSSARMMRSPPSFSCAGLPIVTDVREKMAISQNANSGAYGFSDGETLREHCAVIIDEDIPSSPPDYPTVVESVTSAPQEATRSRGAGGSKKQNNGRSGGRSVGSSGSGSGGSAASQHDDARSLSPLHAPAGWYASAVVRAMIRSGSRFLATKLVPEEDFVALKKAQHLETFLEGLGSDALSSRALRGFGGKRRMRFAFDLDGTLVAPPSRPGDYSTVTPIDVNVELVRGLKAAGHYVIIWTARESDRLGGNVGAIVAAVGRVTLDTLAKYNIPYDELVFGKPQADAYVDSRAVNSMVDTARELGWRSHIQPSDGVGADDAKIEGGVASRSFNTVTPLDDRHVAKTGPLNVMLGELHWYRNIPPALGDLFPRPVELNQGGSLSATIVMTKVTGVPFTHLLINLCLTPRRLNVLMEALHRLHRTKRTQPSAANGSAANNGDSRSLGSGSASEEKTLETDIDGDLVYSNLRSKLLSRYAKHRSLYSSFSVSELGFDPVQLLDPLDRALSSYEENDRGVRASYIHGDPVFSNVLLTREGGIKLIDMRGALGGTLTTAGDVTYDLAKVLQSLCGYDFFVVDREVSSAAAENLRALRGHFWDFVGEHYPEISQSDVRVITASHFFGIVPLHERRSRMREYLKMARELLLVEGLTR